MILSWILFEIGFAFAEHRTLVLRKIFCSILVASPLRFLAAGSSQLAKALSATSIICCIQPSWSLHVTIFGSKFRAQSTLIPNNLHHHMTLLEAELERGRLQSLRSTKNSNEKNAIANWARFWELQLLVTCRFATRNWKRIWYELCNTDDDS